MIRTILAAAAVLLACVPPAFAQSIDRGVSDGIGIVEIVGGGSLSAAERSAMERAWSDVVRTDPQVMPPYESSLAKVLVMYQRAAATTRRLPHAGPAGRAIRPMHARLGGDLLRGSANHRGATPRDAKGDTAGLDVMQDAPNMISIFDCGTAPPRSLPSTTCMA